MRIALALLVGGSVLIYLSAQDYRLNQASKAEPQQITCAELVANGPGDNAHIVLGDFLMCDFAFVYEEQGHSWKKVWVPAVPLGGEFHLKLLAMLDEDGKLSDDVPMPADVKVIVKSTDVSDAEELSEMAGQETLQGLVVNLIESLGSKEKKILRESYPSVDFDDCWIVEVGRGPASTTKLAGFFFGGLAMIGAAAWIALGGRESTPSPQVEDSSSVV